MEERRHDLEERGTKIRKCQLPVGVNLLLGLGEKEEAGTSANMGKGGKL